MADLESRIARLETKVDILTEEIRYLRKTQNEDVRDLRREISNVYSFITNVVLGIAIAAVFVAAIVSK